MSVDITELSVLADRLDSSTTLQTFSASGAFLMLLVYFGQAAEGINALLSAEFDDDGVLLFSVAIALTALLAGLAGFSFLIWDWWLRRPWRWLDVLMVLALGALVLIIVFGVAAGGLLMAMDLLGEWQAHISEMAVALIVMMSLIVGWIAAPSRRIRGAVIGLIVTLALFAVAFLLPIAVVQYELGSDQIAPGIAMFVVVSLVVWVLYRMIQVRLALSANRPRELLLGDVQPGWGSRLAFLCGLPSSFWRLRAMRRPAFWVIFAARPMVYLGVLLALGVIGLSFIPNALVVPLGVILVLVGHGMFYFGKRMAAGYTWSPDAIVDSRPPVLFLRSFRDDQFTFKRPGWKIWKRWLDLWSFRRNADEILIDEIAQYGPVVALGNPGEPHAPFGARRYYASEEEWRDVITDTARAARAIVIAAGDTPSLIWEYELLAREGLLDKTLVLLPSGADPDEIQQALRLFEEKTGSTLAETSQASDVIARIQAADGPLLLRASDRTDAAYLVAIRAHFQRCTAREVALN